MKAGTGMETLKRLRRGDLRIDDRGPTAYLVSTFAHYGIRTLLRSSVKRDNEFVTNEYNNKRDEYWKPSLSVDEFIFGDSERASWKLLDHKLVRRTEADVRRVLLPRLRDRIASFTKPGELVVEFGAGTGRNLGYLARELPDRKFLGLELTPKSVDDARRTLDQFGLAAEMRVADVTVPIELPQRAAVAFSVLALEQLPNVRSKHALEQMSKVASSAVICIEPIRELFPYTLRGITSRLRQRLSDYLQGLPAHARALGLKVVVEERTGFAYNPLNEMCELVIDLR